MHSRSGPSSYRDRTHEFLTVAERLKKSISSASNASDIGGGGGGSGSRLEVTKSASSMQSEFNRRAARMGREIHETSTKLSKLAILAKSTSSFDDPTDEIQRLTAIIKQEITALNSDVVELQLLCNSQSEVGNISSHTSSHSTTVVDDLKSRLMSTTKEFKEVLTKRTENLKTYESRHQLFSSKKEPVNPYIRHRPLASRGTYDSTAAQIPSWAASSSSSQSFGRNSLDGEASSSSQQLIQKQEQQIIPVQDTYMHSRAEALQNVESTIHELSNIFTQLATMVSQQGELAIRIDENMDDTLANVEGAQGALLKYLNSISSNRWLMFKIFFVLVIFLMIFLFFVA